jgi:hypothetical protein
MIILKFETSSQTHQTLFEGSVNDCLTKFDNLTESFEDSGFFMVNEISIDPDSITKVREFATISSGHAFDVIICGGIAGKISKIDD